MGGAVKLLAGCRDDGGMERGWEELVRWEVGFRV
jgi:hypothetical protein